MKTLDNLFKSKRQMELDNLFCENQKACDAALVELETNGHKFIGELKDKLLLTADKN